MAQQPIEKPFSPTIRPLTGTAAATHAARERNLAQARGEAYMPSEHAQIEGVRPYDPSKSNNPDEVAYFRSSRQTGVILDHYGQKFHFRNGIVKVQGSDSINYIRENYINKVKGNFLFEDANESDYTESQSAKDAPVVIRRMTDKELELCDEEHKRRDEENKKRGEKAQQKPEPIQPQSQP